MSVTLSEYDTPNFAPVVGFDRDPRRLMSVAFYFLSLPYVANNNFRLRLTRDIIYLPENSLTARLYALTGSSARVMGLPMTMKSEPSSLALAGVVTRT